jgi:hypothetical protein
VTGVINSDDISIRRTVNFISHVLEKHWKKELKVKKGKVYSRKTTKTQRGE